MLTQSRDTCHCSGFSIFPKMNWNEEFDKINQAGYDRYDWDWVSATDSVLSEIYDRFELIDLSGRDKAIISSAILSALNFTKSKALWSAERKTTKQ